MATAAPVEVAAAGQAELEVTWTVNHCAAVTGLSEVTLRYRLITDRETVDMVTPVGVVGLVELVRLVERACSP